MIRLLSVSIILTLAGLITACDLSGKKTPPDGTSATGATFQVKSVEGEMETDRVHPLFLTPTSRLLNFKACVIDNLYQKQVSNQPFTIWNGQTQVASARSEENGCITWQERPAVNFFAKSEYIFQTRIIRGEGASKGSISIPLAVNPWLHGEELKPVVDLTRGQVKYYNAAAGFQKAESSHLWLEALGLQNIREADSSSGRLTLNATLQIPAQFLAKDSNGADVIVPIQGGLYDMDLVLYVEGEGASPSVLNRISVQHLKAEKGLITKDITISPSRIPVSGHYKFAVRLKPKNAPEGLRSFEGVFDLASVDAFIWTGSTSAKLAAEVYGKQGTFTIGFLETEPEAPAEKTAYYVDKQVGCIFDKVDTTTETPTQRTIVHRIQLCVRRRDNQKPREGVSIDIKRNKGDVVQRKTNENGCVDFEDSITHNFYEPECRHLSKVRLSNPDLGLNEEVQFQLNPWHAFGTFCRDARIVGPDEMALMEDRKACMAARPKSEFFVDAFDMNEQLVDYKIDGHLNLTVQKTLRMAINARAVRPSNQIDGANLPPEPLRQGQYLLRYALIRNGHENPDKAYHFLSGGEMIAHVQGARLIVDVPISVVDRKVINSRNRILLELSAVDYSKIEKVGEQWRPKKGYSYKDIVLKDRGLAPMVWDANLEVKGSGYLLMSPFPLSRLDGSAQSQLELFQPFINEGMVTPDAAKFPQKFTDLGDVIAMGQEIRRLESQRNQSFKDIYAQTQDLRVVTKDKPVNEVITYDGLKAVMETKVTGDELYGELCRFWARGLIPQLFQENNPDIAFSQNAYREAVRTQCWVNRNPGLASVDLFRWFGARHHPFFIFQNVIQVEEAGYAGIRPPGRQFQITVGDQFSMGSRFVNTTDFTVRAPIGKIPVVGKILEIGLGISNTSTFRRDFGNDLTFNTSTTLQVEENLMDVRVSKYRRCMIVRMNPYMTERIHYLGMNIRWVKDEVQREQIRRGLAQRGLMVCSDVQTAPIDIAEKYYYVEPPRGPGTQQDPTDARNRWHSLELRGARDMKAFLLMGKSKLENPDVMDQGFDGLNEWTSNMDELFMTVTPAAPGMFVEDVYF